MGELGNRLVEALDGTGIEIAYGIDRNLWEAYAEIDLKGLDEEECFDGVDCIVVTPVHVYGKVEEMLKGKTECDIVSLEEIIYEI